VLGDHATEADHREGGDHAHDHFPGHRGPSGSERGTSVDRRAVPGQRSGSLRLGEWGLD
jgi:hypothetical protein